MADVDYSKGINLGNLKSFKEQMDIAFVGSNDARLSDARPASDVPAWAKAADKPTYTASEVGAIAATTKGQANGVASLGNDGKVPSTQLPSYVDDVLEGYKFDDDLRELPVIETSGSYRAGFIGKYNNKVYRFTQDYSGSGSIMDYMELVPVFPVAGEAGKIYSDIITDKTYRWSGSQYTAIKGDVVIGTTQGTAYDGAAGQALATKTANIPSDFDWATDAEIRALFSSQQS